MHRKLPSAPPASTQEVRNPKIGQQLGAQPTPRFRVMIEAMTEAMTEAMIDVEIDAVIDPLPPFTFWCAWRTGAPGRRFWPPAVPRASEPRAGSGSGGSLDRRQIPCRRRIP